MSWWRSPPLTAARLALRAPAPGVVGAIGREATTVGPGAPETSARHDQGRQ